MKSREKGGAGVGSYPEVAPLAGVSVDPETLFRALSDATRLKLLLLMQERGELCVCELTDALGLSQPKVSRHLAYLREASVVLDRREGLWVHYRIHPQLPEWAREIIRISAEGLSDQLPPMEGCNCS